MTSPLHADALPAHDVGDAVASAGRKRRKIRFSRRWILPALIAVAYVVLQFVGKPALPPSNDGFLYARATLEVLGDTRAEAEAKAKAVFCATKADHDLRRTGLNPIALRNDRGFDREARLAACSATPPNGFNPASPRYQKIFETRPGFPVLAAPLVALFGVNAGLIATSVLFTALGGLLVHLLLRAVGASPRFAALGQALFYFTPIGWWGGYPVTEGPVLAATVGVLLGAWWLWERRMTAGAAMLAGSLVLGTAVKYSTFLVIAAALVAVVALVCLLRLPGVRHLGTAVLAGISLACLAGIAALSVRYDLPGSTETLQDTFTGHFAQSDVADPWPLLGELNANFWTVWIQEQARSPWLLLAVGLGAVAVFRHRRALGWLTLAVASTGVAAAVAHPVASEVERLMLSVWLLAVVGLPLLLQRLMKHSAVA
ncbi:hypothetical protein [Streptomyces tritici]|uniref:hypothetical protein n=1 Tax=Streptomyces tritici TaxID=2054410 RepID=UPI003AEF9630